MQRRLPDILSVLALLILPLLFFFPQTLGGKTLIPTENLYQYEPYATYREVVQAPAIPHNHLVSDLILENYQWKSFIRRQLALGEAPLWNPNQFAGIPFLAAGQHSALYPLSLIYYVVDLPYAYGWFTVINLWLAGAFMYAFVRALGVSRMGALLAAIIYQFNGFVIASVVFQMMIGGLPWLPLLLLMAEHLITEKPLIGQRKSPILPIIVGAGALGMNILAGHVEITLYSLLITGYYAAGRLIWFYLTPQPPLQHGEGGLERSQRLPHVIRKAVFLAAMIALGFGFGAIQFIPLFEFVQTNWRAERSSLDTVLSYAHPVRDALQFLMPNFYGNPSHHSYFDVFSMQTVSDLTNAAGQRINFIDWGIKNYVEGALYVGILPLLLAVYALFHLTPQPPLEPLSQGGASGEGGQNASLADDPPNSDSPLRIRGSTLRRLFGAWGGVKFIFASLALISLTFMFGLPTYALLYALPGFNQLNSPFRWIYALTVCICVLAALGFDQLIQPRRNGEHRDFTENDSTGGSRWRRPSIIGYIAVFAGLVVLAGLLLSRVFFGQIEPLIERVFRSMALADTAFADARAFYSYEFVNVLIFGVMLTLSGGIFLWFGRKHHSTAHEQSVSGKSSPLRLRGGVGGGVILLLLIADLWLASWGFNPASDPALLDFTPSGVQFLLNKQAEGEVFRFTTLDDPAQRPVLRANAGWMYDLDDIRGYDSIIPRPYVAYMRALAPQGELDFNRIAPLFTVDLDPTSDPPGVAIPTSPLLNWLNVRYIVTHRGTNLAMADGSDPTWTLVHNDEAVRIWENSQVLPRAFGIAAADFESDWLTVSGTDVDYGALLTPSPLTPVQPSQGAAPQGGEGSNFTYIEATITRDTGREKFVDMTLADDGWLIVSENDADGWRAFVRPQGAGEDAEKPYEVERILGIFQGVRLPEGAWTVRLVYSPATFQVGLFGSAMSVVLSTLLIGMWLWGIFVGTSDENASTTVRVARNSIAPIILNLFNRAIDFVFLLVMLRLLTPEDVGVYYYLVIIFGWFDIFSNFGLDLFLIREVARDRQHAGHYFFNVSVLRLILCIVGIALLAGFLLIRQATVTPALSDVAILTIVLLYAGLFPASLSKGMTSVFYAFEQAEKPAAIATITTINKAAFGVIVLALGYGIAGIAAVSIANNILTLLVLVWAGRKFILPASDNPAETYKLDVPLIRRMMWGGAPLLLNHFLATIFFQIDVVILEALKGAVVVAKYSVSYRWLSAINVVPSFFTQALLPIMARQKLEDVDALRRTYLFGIKLMFALAVPIAIGFTFMAELLVNIMGGSQYLPDGAWALQLMIWSIPIGWMNSLTQYALVALDMQRRMGVAFFGAVAFNIVLNLILVPIYSYPAAAITTIASELVLFVGFGWLMEQGLGQRIAWWRYLWRPVVAGAIMLVVTWFLWQMLPYIALGIGSLAYIVVFWWLRPLDEEELVRLRRLLPQRLARWV